MTARLIEGPDAARLPPLTLPEQVQWRMKTAHGLALIKVDDRAAIVSWDRQADTYTVIRYITEDAYDALVGI